MKNIFINFIFFFFILFVLYPDLERIFFINELFAFIGLFFLITNGSYYFKQKDLVVNCVLFFNIYCFLYSVISFVFIKVGSNYEFIRTLPVWYSSLTFFVGIEFVRQIKFRKWFGSLKGNLAIILLSFITPGRFTQQLLFPFMIINR